MDIFLYQVYSNQLKMMEARGCEIKNKHINKLDKKLIKSISKERTSISTLNGEYDRDNIKYKVYYVMRKKEGETEESNSKIIENLIVDSSKRKNIEHILITDIDPKTIKILKSPDYNKKISLFTFEEMYIYAINHCLVPIHTPIYDPTELSISDEEIEEMQQIPSTDIIARLLGLKKGNLVIITVHNPVPTINNIYNVTKLIT